MLRITLVLFVVSVLNANAQENQVIGKNGGFENRRVLVIGIDGLRGDALRETQTPNLDRLIARGVVTYDAIAGGVAGTETEQQTVSGPGWSTILTGVFANKHGVVDNFFRSPNFESYPHFFRYLRGIAPDSWLGSVVEWGAIHNYIDRGSAPHFTYRSIQKGDQEVAVEGAALMRTEDPDVLFLHFIAPDGYGHASGYDPGNTSYRYAIRVTDRRIGQVIDALEAREGFIDGTEDWLVMVISDHGGLDIYHGSQTRYEKEVPFIVSSKHVHQGLVVSPGPHQTAVVPNIFHHLGITVDDNWGLDGEPFGVVPLPTSNFKCSYDEATGSCRLSWRLPDEEVVQGFRLFRNGEVLANVEPGRALFVDTSLSFDQHGISAHYSLETLFADEEQSWPRLQTLLELGGTKALEDNLIAYFPFEDSLKNEQSSSQALVGGGQPAFVEEGKLGKGLWFDGVDDYLVLGSDIEFSFESDFTVALWYRVQGSQKGFPVIIGNKDWRSYTAPGFVLLANRREGDELALQVGDGVRRLDPPTLDIGFDTWYFLAATFDRGGDMTLRIFNRSDERLQEISMAAVDSISSGLPLNLAQDGTGTYPRYSKMYADEVMVWDRLLSPVELRYVYKANMVGLPLSTLLASSDTDQDGLNDRWEIERFGNMESSTNSDPDHDGVSNLLEWMTGSDPNEQSANPLTLLKNSDSVGVSFAVRQESNQHTIALEVTSDLKSWSSVGEADLSVGIENQAAGFVGYSYRARSADLAASCKHFRLRVVRNPTGLE